MIRRSSATPAVTRARRFPSDPRRVVELTPQNPLPLNCGGTLHVPEEVRTGATRRPWTFRTYGPLQLDSAACARRESCPTGRIRVIFSTPVRGAELLRRVRVEPNLKFTISDTARISHEWILDTRLQPRQPYAVVVDSVLTDVFGQKLGATAVKPLITTSYAPSVTYDHGKMLVKRTGLCTVAVRTVNVKRRHAGRHDDRRAALGGSVVPQQHVAVGGAARGTEAARDRAAHPAH